MLNSWNNSSFTTYSCLRKKSKWKNEEKLPSVTCRYLWKIKSGWGGEGLRSLLRQTWREAVRKLAVSTTNCSIAEIPKFNLVSILLRFRSIKSLQIPNLVLILLIFRTIVFILSILKLIRLARAERDQPPVEKSSTSFTCRPRLAPLRRSSLARFQHKSPFTWVKVGSRFHPHRTSTSPAITAKQQQKQKCPGRPTRRSFSFPSRKELVRSLRGYCFAESSRRADSKYRSAACYLPGIKNQLQPAALGRRRTALWGAGIMQDAQTPA